MAAANFACATALLCAMLLLQGAHAHTYFRASLQPFGEMPKAPNATAYFEFMTHDGEAFYQLNVTALANATAAKIVYGDPEIKGEEVVTAHAFEPAYTGTGSFEGVFAAGNFTEEYPWTMDGLMANAGLGHLWAVVTDPADYKNIILAGPVEHFKPGGH